MTTTDERPHVWAIYRRVSTTGQDEHGLGLEVQSEQCEKWLADRGLVHGPTYTDVCSGALLEREEMAELMVASRRKDVPTKIVGVDPTEDAMLDNPEKGDDPTRKLVRTIMGAVNEFERKMIAKRTSAARRVLQRQGKHAGGAAGHGVIVMPDKTKVLDTPLIPLARDGLRMFDIGVSYATIGEYWTQAGWRGLGKAGWPAANVGRKLAHCRKLGYKPSELLSAQAALFTGGLR
jgi:DNA invertase Pin-like site-specific DNA recombinase